MSQLLVTLVSLWSDQVEVDQGQYKYLVTLSWLICSVLGTMSPDTRASVNDHVTRRLKMGMVHWLEADIVKRQLGMIVATVIVGSLCGQCP